jgi:hypothetical protein
VDGEQSERAEAHLVELAAVADILDPVPTEAFEAAVASLAWRSIDAELADLLFDSARHDEQLAGIRSGGASRQLTFEAPGLVVEVEVENEADSSLLGQLVPPGSAAVEICSPRSSVTVAADERGRFWAQRLPGRLFSLRIRRPGSDAWVTTPWVSLISLDPG